MKSLLEKYRSDIALVIGNGINRYAPTCPKNSWADLLGQLAKNHLPEKLGGVPAGIAFTEIYAEIALTEFYDVLELNSSSSSSASTLQQEFCDLMDSWKHDEHHQHIVEWAKEFDRPILTTNFEQILSDAGECTLYRTKREGFTDYYPWENYYGTRQLVNPTEGFGIWHMNGMRRYRRSVRLGLGHYMGSVERTRVWLHKSSERSIFSGKSMSEWDGAASWLHIVFNSPLLIFGLNLEKDEVFFRWLLIERAKYFKKFPERRKDAWYVYKSEDNNAGKNFFLKGVGVVPLPVGSYDDIYGAATWK